MRKYKCFHEREYCTKINGIAVTWSSYLNLEMQDYICHKCGPHSPVLNIALISSCNFSDIFSPSPLKTLQIRTYQTLSNQLSDTHISVFLFVCFTRWHLDYKELNNKFTEELQRIWIRAVPVKLRHFPGFCPGKFEKIAKPFGQDRRSHVRDSNWLHPEY
jgi:hypothetical protein